MFNVRVFKCLNYFRKGALMLFAKENALDDGYETARNNVETDSQNANMANNTQTSNHDNMNEYEIKTLNDLQKNVLLYGIEKVIEYKYCLQLN